MLMIEAKLFCLLVIGFLCFFQKKSFKLQWEKHKYVYIFSTTGVLCAIAETFITDAYVKNLLIILGWCFYAGTLFFLKRYIFEVLSDKASAVRNCITTLTWIAFLLLAVYCSKYETDLEMYILVFGLIITFLLDQYNKIRIDELTKLYNRYGMDVELKEQFRQYERESEDSFYVIACDLDDFKSINDKWGHPEGDRALILVAEVLSRVAKKFRSNVFRIGGDEFVIITDTSEDGLAADITNALKKELDNIEFREDYDIKMSIGFALYDGVTPIDILLKNADKKLYEAKKRKYE